MFPSSEDKRLRAEGSHLPDAQLPLMVPMTFEHVCAFIIARLRHDFISGEDTITAYCEITQPWALPGFPEALAYNNAALYGSKLQEALAEVFDSTLATCRLIDQSDVKVFFYASIMKNKIDGIYGISVRADVIEHTILAA
jgi:hypothetical protein